jgi:predicted nucleotide-binding protein
MLKPQNSFRFFFAPYDKGRYHTVMNSADVASLVPSADDLLALTVEQQGALVLKLLSSGETNEATGPTNSGRVSRHNFFNRGNDFAAPPKYGRRQKEVDESLLEAWSWLEGRGLLAQDPAPGAGWFFVTKAGRKILTQSARFEHLEKLGLDRVKHDLLNGGFRWVGGTVEQQEEAWEWVRMKEKQQKTPGVAAATSATEVLQPSRKVFVVHGHDEGAREKIARFLERAGFEPIILHEQASGGRTVIEKVEAHSNVGFAAVLLTPDDEGCEKGGTPRPRARQNVVLELGYFVGRLGRNRVCALKRGDLEIPSDFTGVVYVPFDDSDGWKQAFGRELQAAGFEIDWGKAMGAH